MLHNLAPGRGEKGWQDLHSVCPEKRSQAAPQAASPSALCSLIAPTDPAARHSAHWL